MQLKNVIYNYFLIAYNIFICIKKITQKKKSSSECDAKNESPYFATRA
jgi:large-conductance mechanosensitive channel